MDHNFPFRACSAHYCLEFEMTNAIRKRAVPRRMRNDYRVKQGLPKRVDVAPPPVCWPLPHHSHLTKNLLPSRLSLFSVRSRVVLKLILPTPHAREFDLVSVTQLILLSQTRVFETTNAIRKPSGVYCLFHVTVPNRVLQFISSGNFKMSYLHQFLMNYPET
jgi:hypothetical protein